MVQLMDDGADVVYSQRIGREGETWALRLTAVVVLPASAGMAIVANDMVMVLLGSKWLAAVPVLRLLCLYAAVRSLDVLLPPVLFARHRQRFLLCYVFGQLIAVSAAAVVGVLWDGAQGVVLCSTPVYCAVMTVMAKKALTELRGSFSELLSEITPILAATASMAGMVFLLPQLILVGRVDSPVFSLAFLSVTGAAIYAAALFAIGSPVLAEGGEVLGWALRRRSAGS
jgi:PST family polysaccharide transporter